jgi:hypothetical protein
MTRVHVDLRAGYRVQPGGPDSGPPRYRLVGVVTLDDQEVSWGALTIDYVVREAVQLTRVELGPYESDKPVFMPVAVFDLLDHKYLMEFVNSDIRSYRRIVGLEEATPTVPSTRKEASRPPHRPPLPPDIWMDRADAVVETLKIIRTEIRRASELGFEDVPPLAYDILRDKWIDDVFDGEPSKGQVANRVRATREQGYVTGDFRDSSIDYGPEYLARTNSVQE